MVNWPLLELRLPIKPSSACIELIGWMTCVYTYIYTHTSLPYLTHIFLSYWFCDVICTQTIKLNEHRNKNLRCTSLTGEIIRKKCSIRVRACMLYSLFYAMLLYSILSSLLYKRHENRLITINTMWLFIRSKHKLNCSKNSTYNIERRGGEIYCFLVNLSNLPGLIDFFFLLKFNMKCNQIIWKINCWILMLENFVLYVTATDRFQGDQSYGRVNTKAERNWKFKFAAR